MTTPMAHKTGHNKFSSFSNTAVVTVFRYHYLWWYIWCSNLPLINPVEPLSVRDILCRWWWNNNPWTSGTNKVWMVIASLWRDYTERVMPLNVKPVDSSNTSHILDWKSQTAFCSRQLAITIIRNFLKAQSDFQVASQQTLWLHLEWLISSFCTENTEVPNRWVIIRNGIEYRFITRGHRLVTWINLILQFWQKRCNGALRLTGWRWVVTCMYIYFSQQLHYP